MKAKEIQPKKKVDKHLVTVGIHKQTKSPAIKPSNKKKTINKPSLLSFNDDDEEDF